MSAGREPVKGHGGGNTSAPIIGIDLGTTFSVVAIAGWPHASDPARVLSGADGRELIPSVVRLSAELSSSRLNSRARGASSASRNEPRIGAPPLVTSSRHAARARSSDFSSASS
ncbi:MAG: hypothetical protein ACK5Z4_08170, partial [Planctomyces sp.]